LKTTAVRFFYALAEMKSLLAVLLVSVSSLDACTAEPPAKAAQELDIREATCRHQFEKIDAGLRQMGKSFCLSVVVDDKAIDPDDEFMKRFIGNQPPAKKGSDCEWKAAGQPAVVNGTGKRVRVPYGFFDKRTGERGLLFSSAAIKWVSDAEVEVSGGYSAGSDLATGSIYYLRKVDGRWKVIKDVMALQT